jgi:energy-coupling factor transport system ATP-binding protein
MPIVIRGAGFSYFERVVLERVDLTVEEGSVHLVVGSTGCGKTTLALIIAGLVKPTTGEVLVDGTEPASPKFDRSLLQLAFQFPEAQIFENTVEKEIEYGPRNFGLAPDAVRERRRWAMQCVGLSEAFLGRDPSSLSFGERRKVALAGVIAVRPRYLILDEPLAGLDWHGRRHLVDTIAKLKSEGVATLVLTHETDLMSEIGDRVAVLDRGRLTDEVAPEHLLSASLAMPADHAFDPATGIGAAPGGEGRAPAWLLPDYLVAAGILRAKGWPVATGSRSVEELAQSLARALRPSGR